MSDLKITVDQLKNYLGTDLKGVHYREGISLDRSLTNTNIMAFVDNETDAKLLFYRLSDIDKEIDYNGERFVPLEKLRQTFKFATTGYVDFDRSLDLQVEPFRDAGDVGDVFINMLDSMFIMQLLYKWHFWIFGEGYFEQGLVIDKMKISKK